jgi:hypothetical protein
LISQYPELPQPNHRDKEKDGDAEELLLLSLRNHCFLRVDPASGRIVADSPGPLPDGSDGTHFVWKRAP